MNFRKSRQILIIAATVMTVVAGLCPMSNADDVGLPVLFVEQCEDVEEESERECLLTDLAVAAAEAAFHDLSSLDIPLVAPTCVGIPIACSPHPGRGPPVV
jgi:hypothetical protein